MSSQRFNKVLLTVVSFAACLPFLASADDDFDEWSDEARPEFDQVVVFGDSLSDPGNVFVVTGQYSVRPFAPIPSAPYAIGGMHFTNGATWAERLSRALDSRTGTGPALRVPQVYTNYAFGGARARAAAASASPSLGAQVTMYIGNTGGVASPEALHVVWFGANDVRDALEALAADPSGGTSFGIVQTAILAIRDNVVALWSAGARTFLVPNVPNLALTPAVAAQPAQVRGAALQLSAAYNAGLAQLLGQLQAQLPGVRIVPLDIFGLLNGIVAAPSAYGIVDATTPCLQFGVVVGAVCAQPQTYLFWDAIHPTAAVHKILAERALTVLTP
jgi:phospholipase/lecithinase/hemolysin